MLCHVLFCAISVLFLYCDCGCRDVLVLLYVFVLHSASGCQVFNLVFRARPFQVFISVFSVRPCQVYFFSVCMFGGRRLRARGRGVSW